MRTLEIAAYSGGAIEVRAIVTSCSWDLPVSLINGERCTPIRVEVGTAAEVA